LGVVSSILKALALHFRTYAIYNSNDSDILIIATRGAALPIPDERVFQAPQLRAELDRIGIQGIADLRLRKIGDNRTIGPLLQQTAVPPNSDFFPFVDLNAPRLRFMGARATELSDLTILPIPILEILDSGASRGPTIAPSANSSLHRDNLIQKALAIRRAMLDGYPTSPDMEGANDLMRIDSNRDRCADAGMQNAWIMAVQNISDFTATYLTPTELEGIWNKITSSPCYHSATAEQKTRVDLLAAISRRDAPNIVKFGTDLLGRQASNSEADLAYLSTVTAAAHIHMGQIAQAHRLLEEQWKKLDNSGPYRLSLLSLRAQSGSATPLRGGNDRRN
jgi:hypothetical protein